MTARLILPAGVAQERPAEAPPPDITPKIRGHLGALNGLQLWGEMPLEYAEQAPQLIEQAKQALAMAFHALQAASQQEGPGADAVAAKILNLAGRG